MALVLPRCPSTIKPIALAIITSLASLALAAPPAPTELPAGGTVAAGSAVISQRAANLTIDQSSSRAIINWNTFNIGSQASVVFNQPGASAVALNRVLSSDPSAIYGRLSATGQIFLINPAGIVFGPGSSVNTAGIVASTLSLSDPNFMSGNYRFERNGSTGAILNQGTITANGGYVALLAPEVRNEGVIRANLGTVALATGEAVTLTFDAGNQLKVAVDPSTLKTLIENKHIIQADGGTVLMASSAAADVLGSVIRNTGIIEANSITSINGEVVLYAANGTTLLEGSGRIEARGVADGQTGGTIKLLGNQVGMFGNSSIDASGAAGGGTVLVGGNFHGAGPEANASATYVGQQASINADATISGNGGNVAVWSNESSQFYGSISARGGATGGNGGGVETSSENILIAAGNVNAGAPNGLGGVWLLDPFDVTISNNADVNPNIWAGTFNATATGANANAGTIQTALNTGTSVTIATGAIGAETGNITVFGTADAGGAVNIVKSAGGTASLTLQAAGSIFVNSGANISSSSAALNVTLNSGNDNGVATANGAIFINGATIQSNGGNITLGGGVNPLTTPAIGTFANVDGIRLAGATLTSGAGNIALRGQGVTGSSFADGVSMDTAAVVQSTTGAISITGAGGLLATGNANNGIILDNATTRISTVDGAITLTGTGGSTAGPGGLNRGIQIGQGPGPVVESTGAGTITLTGTGGSSVDTGQNTGILLNGIGTQIRSLNGTILMTGVGGAATGLTASAGSPGISIQNGPLVASTGTAPITLVGTGGTLINWNFGQANQGITLSGAAVTRISSVDGAINMTGTGGTSTVTGGVSRGINISGGTVVDSTGTATITLTGTSGTPADTVGGNQGIGIFNAGTRISSVNGAIALTGTGGGGGTANNGVGIFQGAAVSSTGSAPISITGASTSTGDGLVSTIAPNSTIGGAAATGNITLTADTMDFPNAAVQTTGTVSLQTTTPSRTITLSGLAGATSATALVVDSAEIAQISAANLNVGSASNALLSTGGSSLTTTANLTLTANVINAVLAGAGSATLNAGTAMTVSGSAVGVTGTAGTTMTVAAAGLNSGAGLVQLVGSGDLTLNGVVSSSAGGNSVTLASTAANFINNAGAAAVSVPATGRFLIYSGSPLLDTLSGLTAPNTRFSTNFGDIIPFAGSGFLYRVASVSGGGTVITPSGSTTSDASSDILQPAQALQAVNQNFVQAQVNPDLTGAIDPLFTADPLRVGSDTTGINIGELCVNTTGDQKSQNDETCDSARRSERKARYKNAIEVIRRIPTVADIPLCGPNAPEVCMPTKPGIVEDAALGPIQLNIPATDVRRKVAYLFGNNDYRGDIPQLKTPVADVAAIGRVLQDRLGYEVTLVPNATKATMVRILTSLSEKSTQDESVLIFYAGHGYQMDDSKAGFWIPTDASASDPSTWLSNNDIQRFLNRIDAKQIIVVSDSCFSGTLTKEQSIDAPRTSPREQLLSRRAVVTLSSGDEEPVSDDGLEGHSIFAYYFLDEMRRIQKLSPASVAFERLREKVVKSHPQTPQLGAVLSAGHMTGANYLFEVQPAPVKTPVAAQPDERPVATLGATGKASVFETLL